MLQYIKKPYVSLVEGVTNTRTAWKVTTDVAGLNIVDEAPLSADNLNVFNSTILVPAGEQIYIWYQLELSTGEVKEWIGPKVYVSREDNITSDLKPVVRVKTPSATWDDDNLYSGYNNLVIKSSNFNGDALDGHLSTSWVFKTPEGKILHYSLQDVTNRTEITLNRFNLNLANYEYIDCYIKHHSASGSASDFGVTRIPMVVYPFKFVGSNSFNARLHYNFSIVPYDVLLPNVDNIKIVNISTGLVVYSITDVSVLDNMLIPANTLKPDEKYRMEIYTINHTTYPIKMDVSLTTKPILDTVVYNNLVEYSLQDMTREDDTSLSTVSNDLLAIGRLYNSSIIGINKTNNLFYKLTINTDDSISVTNLTATSDITDLLVDDCKLFTISKSRAYLLYRVGDTLSLIRLLITGDNKVVVDSTFNTMEFLASAVNHNLEATATISEDEKYIYVYYISSTIVGLCSFNTSTGVVSILDGRNDLTLANYNPDVMSLQCVGDGKLISIGGYGTLWYFYNVLRHEWLAIDSIPSELLTDVAVKYRTMVLADRSVLFLYDFGASHSLYRIKPTLANEVEVIDEVSPITLKESNVYCLDSMGVFRAYSKSLAKRMKLIPTNII